MSLPAPFDTFIFNDRLEQELRFFIEHPEELPPVVCFSGEPGIGKTSFAMAYAKECGQAEPRYVALNEVTGSITDKIKRQVNLDTTVTLSRFMNLAEEREGHWGQIVILDEFHNLVQRNQDYFKTVFDTMNRTTKKDEDDFYRVLICINTDWTKNRRSAMSVLSEPIYSRCHHIDFNTSVLEEDAYIDKLVANFPCLTRSEIKAYAPDMRRITREHRLRSKQAA